MRNAHTKSNPYLYCDGYSDRDGYLYANSDRYLYANGDRYLYPNSYSDRYGYFNRNGYCNHSSDTDQYIGRSLLLSESSWRGPRRDAHSDRKCLRIDYLG